MAMRHLNCFSPKSTTKQVASPVTQTQQSPSSIQHKSTVWLQNTVNVQNSQTEGMHFLTGMARLFSAPFVNLA